MCAIRPEDRQPQSRAILSIREHGEKAKVLAPGHLISAAFGSVPHEDDGQSMQMFTLRFILITSGAL